MVAAAIVLTFTWTVASAADLVVVEARGVPLRPGQTIDGSKPLTLLEGQNVVLISSAGKTVKLRGPFDQPPVADTEVATADLSGALRSMVTAQAARTDKLGVVRGAASQVVPPEPWLIDVTHIGNRCLPDGAPITLWRPGAGGEMPLVISPSDRSWRARADWPSNVDRMVMPQAVPLRQRASYVVSLGGKEKAITLITIPAAVSTDPMRIAWMNEAGCDAQAQALLTTALKAADARGH
ncbi:MAG TPA: hypothetical protein VN809_04665 [Telmatospirillum sp.]|nr:hypothetical protein [Telmatospirillum sp.]